LTTAAAAAAAPLPLLPQQQHQSGGAAASAAAAAVGYEARYRQQALRGAATAKEEGGKDNGLTSSDQGSDRPLLGSLLRPMKKD